MVTLSWNCNGLLNHYPELQLLTKQYQPDYICLQETHLKTNQTITCRNYKIYRKDRMHNTYGGVAILTHNNNYSENININTTLEAIAVRIQYPKPITLCSIYIPPDQNPSIENLQNLIAQLPPPYIITGDFNAYNPIWNYNYTSQINDRGKIIEAILDSNTLLNNGAPTHFSTQHGTFSTIDLTLCDPRITSILHWDIIPSLNGSDHFPAIISNLLKTDTPQTKPTGWKLKTADWGKFTTEISKENLYLEQTDDINIKTNHFITKLKEIATNTIGIKKLNNNKRSVPWWNKKCYEAIKNNNKALNKYRKRRKPNRIKENTSPKKENNKRGKN